ncbi:MAG: polysaccharide deacetylase family protein [Armatimonadota bacterium]
MRLYFNYSIDCELPLNTPYTGPERRPFFGGPKSWDAAEASVRGFAEQMTGLGLAAGTSLCVYPDVARHQQALYREMAAAGVEVALHLNGLRYSRLQGDRGKWLGEMSEDEQREALRTAKADLEDTLGRPVLGYRACYGSANNDTLRLCDEVGFRWASNSSNRYRPEFAANWSGSWPFAHHASAVSNLIPGTLRLFEIPVTVGMTVYYDESIRQPLDLRVETPPERLGEGRQKLRAVIEENIIEMDRRAVPLRAIIGVSHNTNPFGAPATHQAQNLDWTVRHARELAAEHGLEFVPASFLQMTEEAERIGSY